MTQEKRSALLYSHGFTSVTGFAKQTLLVAQALVEDGWDVKVIHRDYHGEAITFPEGTKTDSGRDIGKITMLPMGQHPRGEDIFPIYISKYKPDVVFTLTDIWDVQFIANIQKTYPWKWVGHYVFDTENIVFFWNDNVRRPDQTIVPAKFAFDTLKKLGHTNVNYIPHGVDTNVYRPATYDEKMNYRRELGIPQDAFIISCVAHNQPRKKLYRLLHAFKMFSPMAPNAVVVYHASPQAPEAWDLVTIAKDLGITDKVLFTNLASKMVGDLHVSEEDIRKLYCASDVHALPTGGEGFGIPLVEAMACGIPNVATAYTTTKEFLCDEVDGKLVNTRGIAVPYGELEAHAVNGMWALIDVRQMAQAFELLYKDPSLRHEMGTKAREFAVENYDNARIKELWKEFFNNIPDERRMQDLTKLRVIRAAEIR